jgi:glutathione S-transferase
MAPLATPLRFIGAPGSPYTRKMRALLRYRRIDYRVFGQGSPAAAGLPRPKVHLLPTFFLPDADGKEVAVVDSTPLIRRFEAEFDGRAVVPSDPAVAFIDYLLEDFADEWLTKAMFHYRWAYQADVDKAAAVLPLWQRVDVTQEQLAPFSKMIAERQIGRLYVVGSNETTGPVIEASYRRFLRAFDAHLIRHPYLMGRRPGASDFGTLGQLTQLVLFDPTPAAVALEESPRVVAWVDFMEDLSGLEVNEAAWISREDVGESLREILAEAGRGYTPVMLANADAVARGNEQVECTVESRPWVQQPFPYQAKCLQWLREQHAALSADDRATVDGWLKGTGCEALFTGT